MDGEVLVEFTRGDLVEAVHRGHIAVVDARGSLLAWAGDPDRRYFLRSSAKPLQLIPLLEDHLDERYGFQEDELAVMAASHEGQERHTQAVKRILARIGLDESALRCGIHVPGHQETYRRLLILGGQPGPLHNNCSGKHAGMLALAVAGGYSAHDYPSRDHPVQRRILEVVRQMSGVDDPVIGVDGCGVPVFGIPLRAMAYTYARLIDPRDLPAGRAEACRRVTAAMRAHPGMVSGAGRLEEGLIPAAGGRLVAKGGAEGLMLVGIAAAASPTGWGIGLVLKMEDGSGGSRALAPALLEALAQLGVLTPDARARLSAHDFGPVYNHVHQVVGVSRPAFRLHRGAVSGQPNRLITDG